VLDPTDHMTFFSANEYIGSDGSTNIWRTHIRSFTAQPAGPEFVYVANANLWITDALQSPERPYAVEMMDFVIKRRFTEAMKVYWQMQPLIQGIYDLQAPLLLHESHPWAHMKYFQWVTGGNGSLLPLKPAQYLPALDAQGRELIKSNFKKAGIAPLDRPEDEFLVGKVAYARGVRAQQLASKPLYA
jgi:4-hydroxy-tetrahydrodipicolinate synthase